MDDAITMTLRHRLDVSLILRTTSYFLALIERKTLWLWIWVKGAIGTAAEDRYRCIYIRYLPR